MRKLLEYIGIHWHKWIEWGDGNYEYRKCTCSKVQLYTYAGWTECPWSVNCPE